MMSDRVTVKVLQNEGYIYIAGSRLTQVLEFESACGHVQTLLDFVYRQLTNTDDPETDWVELDWANRYRADERALDIGDVVVVGEQAFAIDSIAWRRVTVDATQIVGAA